MLYKFIKVLLWLFITLRVYFFASRLFSNTYLVAYTVSVLFLKTQRHYFGNFIGWYCVSWAHYNVMYVKPYQVDTDAARRLLNTRRRMYETVDKLRNPKIRGIGGGGVLACKWQLYDVGVGWVWPVKTSSLKYGVALFLNYVLVPTLVCLSFKTFAQGLWKKIFFAIFIPTQVFGFLVSVPSIVVKS